MEYDMSFLMGLNDSFTQIRDQLLLMDPLPPINRFFFLLVSQEEHQRKVSTLGISSADSTSSNIAFAVKADYGNGSINFINNYSASNTNQKGQKRERSFCIHCNFHGYTVDRCFKLHGYSSGYKPKYRKNSINTSAVNQVATEIKND
ncbi:hypothetical protein ACOSQ3_007346 [Xanthoceras sorbifolium]